MQRGACQPSLCGKWGFKVACLWAWQCLILEAVHASSLGIEGRGGGGGETSPPSVHCPRKGFKSQVCKKEEMCLIYSGFEACRSFLMVIPFPLQAGLAQRGSPSQALETGTVSWCLHPGPGAAARLRLCSCSSQ